MLEAGFRPDFPADVLHEVQLLKQGAPKPDSPGVRDLRSLLWSSIDNDSSRDLDQVECVEGLPGGGTRLLVGIADVDVFRPQRISHGPPGGGGDHLGLYRRDDLPHAAG